MIKALLVDDEAPAREELSHLITTHCPQLEIVATASSVREAMASIKEFQPDVLFLDIEMPEQNGFNLLEAYDEYPFSVIFTTAYDEYAIKAIRYSALDYLLKPVQRMELLAAIERMIKSKDSNKRLQNLREQNNAYASSTLMLNNQDGFEKVDIDSIVRFEAHRNYTFIYFKEGRKLLMSQSLRHFEDLLEGPQFIRCHRSHLVNIDFITKVDKGKQWYFLLSNNESIPIAHRKKSAIMTLFKQ